MPRINDWLTQLVNGNASDCVNDFLSSNQMKPRQVCLYEFALVLKEFELNAVQSLAITSYLKGHYTPRCPTCEKRVVPGFLAGGDSIICTECCGKLKWELSLDSFDQGELDDDMTDEIRSLWVWLFEQGVFSNRLPTWLSFPGTPLDRRLVERLFIWPLQRDNMLFLFNFVIEDDNMIKTFIYMSERHEVIDLPPLPKIEKRKLRLPYGADLPKAFTDNPWKVINKQFPYFICRILERNVKLFESAKKYTDLEDLDNMALLLREA